MSCGSARHITQVIGGGKPDLNPADYSISRYHG